MQNTRKSLAFQSLVLARVASKVFFTACSYIYSHQPCSNIGLRLGRFPRSLLCSLKQPRHSTQPEPAVDNAAGAVSCHHRHGVWGSEVPPVAIPGMCIHPCHRTPVSSCFKISLRNGWALPDPRRTCLDELFLQWGSCTILFQLKFGALTLPGMESKRTCREGLGGLDDSSLRGLVK